MRKHLCSSAAGVGIQTQSGKRSSWTLISLSESMVWRILLFCPVNADSVFHPKDRLLQRSQWAINMPSPTNEACKTMANWLDNGSINNDERASIIRGPLALLNIGYVKDASMVKITTAIEPLVKWYFKRKQQVRGIPISL